MGASTEQVQQAAVQFDRKCIAVEQQLHRSISNDAVIASTPSTPPNNEEAECLKELIRLIKNDGALRETGVVRDEEFLLSFVRGKTCDSEKALKTLQNYMNIRKVKYPKFFQTLSPRHFRYLLDGSTGKKFCGILKYPDRQGRIVAVSRCSLFDSKLHKGDDVVETFVTAGLELLRTDLAPKNGLVLVIDASGFGLRHAREFTMSRIYLILQIFLSSYPVKYKGIHILNNAYIFDTILTLIKQLIPKKLRDRIHLHGNNYASLHEHVPPEILPACFGGHLSEDECYDTDLEQRMLDKTEYYEKMAQNW